MKKLLLLAVFMMMSLSVWASEAKIIDRFCLPRSSDTGQFTVTKFAHEGRIFYVVEKTTGYGTAISIVEVK